MQRSSRGSEGSANPGRGAGGPGGDAGRGPPRQRPRWKWYQFGVWVWFPAALLVSLVMAAMAGMIHGDRFGGRLPRDFFILMAAALPLGVVIVMSLLRWLSGTAGKDRRTGAGKDRRH